MAELTAEEQAALDAALKAQSVTSSPTSRTVTHQSPKAILEAIEMKRKLSKPLAQKKVRFT